MPLKVVGAGLGRTGTNSLKLALERLLGEPCYHMIEVFGHPDHVGMWQQAALGKMPDWDTLFAGYGECVDWPAASFWREQSEAYPDSVVLLSTRDSESWWHSCSNTIFEVFRQGHEQMPGEWMTMMTDLMANRFTRDVLDETAAIAAYEHHNEVVRATAPPDRLVEWHPGDGWGPLCRALNIDVPDEPFPHVNTTEEFRSRAGFDA